MNTPVTPTRPKPRKIYSGIFIARTSSNGTAPRSAQFLPALTDFPALVALMAELDSTASLKDHDYVLMLRESNQLGPAELDWLARLRAYLRSRDAILQLMASPGQQRALAEAGFSAYCSEPARARRVRFLTRLSRVIVGHWRDFRGRSCTVVHRSHRSLQCNSH